MISLGYLVLCKNKKKLHGKELIKLRDTRGTISFALRISFPNKDYKPKGNDHAQKRHKSSEKPVSKQERLRLNSKRWKERNPDKYKQHLEWVRQWRKKNRKKSLEYNQKWRDTHREEYRAQQKEYHRRPEVKKRVKAAYNRKKESVNKSTKNDTKSIKGVRKNA